MHVLLSTTKALTEPTVDYYKYYVTKFSEPMRNKSQSKTAPEWAPPVLMIDRHDPCTVQPAYLFPFCAPVPETQLAAVQDIHIPINLPQTSATCRPKEIKKPLPESSTLCQLE